MKKVKFEWPWGPMDFIQRKELDALVMESVKKIKDEMRFMSGNQNLPVTAVFLGSVMQGVLAEGDPIISLSFDELLPFKIPGASAAGHVRKLEVRRVDDQLIFICRGRVHFYEVGDQLKATYLSRVLAAAGVKNIIFTNAAGGINKYGYTFQLGDLVIVNGIYNLNMPDPLGRLLPVKFIDPSQRIDKNSHLRLMRICYKKGIRHWSGTAAAVTGPSYEDEGQRILLGKIGAASVGMSVVNEIYAAIDAGIEEIAAISVVTDLVWTEEHVTHEKVAAVSKMAQKNLDPVLTNFFTAEVEI